MFAVSLATSGIAAYTLSCHCTIIMAVVGGTYMRESTPDHDVLG